MNNKLTGDIGEKIACNFLKKQGLKILETNYRNKIGEIDIIAKDSDLYVFVEVKTRSSCKFGYPREAINSVKQKKIKNTAISYLKYNKILDKVGMRFDCLEIVGDKLDYGIEHLKNIF